MRDLRHFPFPRAPPLRSVDGGETQDFAGVDEGELAGAEELLLVELEEALLEPEDGFVEE